MNRERPLHIAFFAALNVDAGHVFKIGADHTPIRQDIELDAGAGEEVAARARQGRILEPHVPTHFVEYLDERIVHIYKRTAHDNDDIAAPRTGDAHQDRQLVKVAAQLP